MAGGCEVHHRRPRASGGSSAADTNTPANLVLVCVDCHRWAESHRERARADGWLVRQGSDPAAVPVLVYGGRAVLLHPTDPRYT